MAYLISEMGEELLEDVRRFCGQIVRLRCREADREEKHPADVWQQAKELGYHTLTVPEAYGGLGLSNLDAAAILEEIAMADAGLATSLSASNLALAAVFLAGSEVQKEQAAELVLEGGLGAFCLTEDRAGSDVAAVETTAVRQPDGSYVLNGRKRFITNGSTAAFYCVLARMDDSGSQDGGAGCNGSAGRTFEEENGGGAERNDVKERRGGLTLFLVWAGTEGLGAGPQEDKLGLRTCDTCEVLFEQCRIPAEAVLGSVGQGQRLALAALNEGRAWMGCLAVGVAQQALQEAAVYSMERQQFGRPIIENQALAFRLADMDMQIESARQMVVHALTKMERAARKSAASASEGTCGAAGNSPNREKACITGKAGSMDFAREAAMAKCLGADAAVAAANLAMDVLGGYGFSRDYPVEKLLRDARAFQVMEGTGEVQRMCIARALAKTAGG